ncbi:MAG: TIGR04283 family arsenosugar biosynthesis glycosyltransferase [Myxococcales bacterium]|nr:TIGR04283 family arsenosugar biosynthesis glycosyltransferase [Myxococcales bacterium]
MSAPGTASTRALASGGADGSGGADASGGVPRLSVIVPTLNEARRIQSLMSWLGRLNGIDEVVVSDGGSDDGTAQLARDSGYPGALQVLEGPRGRGQQLNRGARAARGQQLLFIHADCLPPRDSAYWIRRTLRQPDTAAGAFKTWHVSEERLASLASGCPGVNEGGSRPWLHLADLRSRYTRLPYGDQGLFITRESFERSGGYPDQPLMEDLEFSRRLCRFGAIRTAPSCMLVSGRRFEARPLRDTCLVNVFPVLYGFGVPATRLAAWYRDTR